MTYNKTPSDMVKCPFDDVFQNSERKTPTT